MPEDIAITSSKSDVDPCSNGRDTDRQKSTDRRTDGFSALYSRSFKEFKIFLIKYNFLASVDIKVFGRTYLFAMLLLIGLAFVTSQVFLFSIIGASLSEPHINVKFMRSVCLYVHDTKIYKSSTNLQVPLVVDCSVHGGFDALFCTPTFNKHVVTNNLNKQVLVLRSKFIDC